MKIRHFITAISIASLGFFGVGCKSTKTAKGGGDDGAYVGYDSGNGEYDNVYEMGGSGDDTYSYESADDTGGNSYNYESNDYSSSPAPTSSKPSKPAYSPPPTKPASKPAPTPAARSSHTVQRGDTLFNISRRYGTSVAAIQNANGLNGDLIKIGEVLTIP
jgi:LysM repeat protein